MEKILYSKYSNQRAKEYAIRTDIVEENGVRFVRKIAMSQEAEMHVASMIEKYDKLSKCFQNSRFCVNIGKRNGMAVDFEYITGKSYEQILDEELEKESYDKFYDRLIDFSEEIRKAYKPEAFVVSEEFCNVFGNVNLDSNIIAGRNVDIDLTFSNVLVKNESWVIIDYEWTFDFLIPINYILWRAIREYMNYTGARGLLSETELFRHINISDQEKLEYEKMEQHFQDAYCYRNVKNLYGMQEKFGKGILTQGEIVELPLDKQKLFTLQVYYDNGLGFKENESVFYNVQEDDKGICKVTIQNRDNCRHLRIDPAEKECFLKVISMRAVSDDGTYSLKFCTNGIEMQENVFLFNNEDPQIDISGLRLDTIKIEFVYQIENVPKQKKSNHIMVKYLIDLDKASRQKQDVICHLNEETDNLRKRVEQQENLITTIENSKSWRVTKPLRKATNIVKDIVKNYEKKFSQSDYIIYNVESPIEDGVDQNGYIVARGWAFHLKHKKIRLTVYIGQQKYPVLIHLQRNDVGDAYIQAGETSRLSGFEFRYKLDDEMWGKRIDVKFVFQCGREKWEVLRHVQISSYEEGHNVRALLHEKLDDYGIWTLKNKLSVLKEQEICAKISQMSYQPLISILMPTYNAEERLLKEALESICVQLYKNWELCIVDDCSNNGIDVEDILKPYVEKGYCINYRRLKENSNISLATNAAFEMAQGEYVFLMDHDDLIEKNALSEVVEVLNYDSEIEILYSDDDKIDMDGKRFAPQFKPDYSPELLLSFMYFSHIFVLKRSLYEQVGGCRKGYEGSQDYDLALRATEFAQKIYHIPLVLYHWRATPQSTAFSADAKPESIQRGLKAVEDAVKRRNIPARVEIPEYAQKGHLGIFTLRYNDVEQPLVSIVIPTKNHKDILKRCVDSIKNKTTYSNYEIILVDNESDDNEVLSYYQTLDDTIIRVPNIDGKFNFSHMVNEGVRRANGTYVILLNNDTEVIEPSWIENLLVYQKIEGVGVVGSRLLYSDNTVQHAGVVLGMANGIASHAFKLFPDYDGGMLSFAKVARNYSAVTAAAFMTTKKIYEQVGGFDEKCLAVSYNDVDYCLKVQKAGYRIVYNSEALLYHHEGKSRGTEQTGHYSDGREEYSFIHRWFGNNVIRDKYYNANLSLDNEKFEVDLRHHYVKSIKPKKVLLVTHNLNFEGAPLVQYNIALCLTKKGYEFEILSLEEGPLREKYEDAGMNVRIVGLANLENLAQFEEYCENVYLSVASEKYDLIYANTLTNYWCVQLAEKMKCGIIWAIHESTTIEKFFSYAQADIVHEVKKALKRATKVLFVANATAKLYDRFDAYNYCVIHNGIDVNKVDEVNTLEVRQRVRAELGIDEDTVLVSLFGTLCARKGQKEFVEIAKRINEENKDKFKFLIMGAQDSEYGREVMNLVETYQLQETVNIQPACQNIYQYYTATDIYVCTSYEESSPLTLLEAMAFGKGIVSTDVFGIPELVRNNQDGILCQAVDIEGFAKAIIKLAENYDLYQRLGTSSYYRVRTFFDQNKIVNEYERLMNEVQYEDWLMDIK